MASKNNKTITRGHSRFEILPLFFIPSNAEARIFHANQVNIFSANALAPYIVRPLVAMMAMEDKQVFHEEELQQPAPSKCRNMIQLAYTFFMFSQFDM